MKGIILAGGNGSRMYPMTKSVSKQLIPVYDKPTIYYPLASLMEAGIREVLIITTPRDEGAFVNLLGTGKQLGMDISYTTQEDPTGGIAQALIIAEEYINGEPVCLILGDNILFGSGFNEAIREASELKSGARILGIEVPNPEQFGVIVTDDAGSVVLDIVEKPIVNVSNIAVPGIYFFDETASKKAKTLSPSHRGELEITDVNKLYLNDNQLQVSVLTDNDRWYDTGSAKGLMEASLAIQSEATIGNMVGHIELIAYRKGFISEIEFKSTEAFKNNKTEYSKSMRGVL